MTKFDKLHEWLLKQEDYYYDLSFKALEKGNAQGSYIHTGEASAFQRARYALEMLETESLEDDSNDNEST